MVNVEHIFVAPLKNAPTRAVQLVDAIAGEGLEGDRNLTRYGPRGAQLTNMAADQFEAFANATGYAMRPEQPRRNIVTRGVRLNDLVGQRFRIGEALCEGIELCEPCRKFQQLTHPEVIRFFSGKGGLRARIVAGGVIRIGDPVTPA
jgi:MOSC domain-containing protein YiiM